MNFKTKTYRWGLALTPILAMASLNAPVDGSQVRHPVQVEILADSDAAVPGEAMRVGVQLTIEPGWHVYWINPGDAGLPTQVQYSNPEGCSVSAPFWPVPDKFEQPGEIVGYGYSESLLLGSKVEVSETAASSEGIELKAKVSWLACEKLCIPGSADVVLELPVRPKANAQHRELFDSWQERLPSDAGEDSFESFEAKFSGQPAELGEEGGMEITLGWDGDPGEVDWYPTALEALEIGVERVTTRERLTTISFRATLLPGVGLTEPKLPSLVVYSDASGVRHGVWLDVPLR